MEETTHQSGGGIGDKKLPNATTALVLGISSIVIGCCCFGPVGLILAVIGFVMGNKDKGLYEADPAMWDPKSYKNSKTGRTLSLIGIIVSIIGTLLIIWQFIQTGSLMMDMDGLEEMMEQYQ